MSLTVEEIANLIQRSRSHVKLLLARGDIKGEKKGGRWLGSEASARAWAAREHRPGPRPKARRR